MPSNTTNLNLYKPDVGETGWGGDGKVGGNWDILDLLVSTLDVNALRLNRANPDVSLTRSAADTLKLGAGDKFELDEISAVGKVNNILFVDGVKHATLKAAIDSLSNADGIVISTIPETFSVDPFTNTISNQGLLVILGPGTWTTNVPIQLKNHKILCGSGRGFVGGTRIVAGASLGTNPIIRIAAPNDLAFGTRVENMAIDCNGDPNVTGIYSDGANEQSGVFNVLVRGIAKYGINFDATVGLNSSGAAQTYSIQHVELSFATGDQSSAVGLRIVGAATGPAVIGPITVNGNNATTEPTNLIELVSLGVGLFQQIHVEHGTNGMSFITSASAGFVVNQVTGGPSMTTVVNLASTSGVHQDFVITGINKGDATNAVVDTDHGTTLTNVHVPFYASGGGSLPHPVEYLTSGGVRQFTRLLNTGTIETKRIKANQSTALVAGDFALSAGWGNTASAGSIIGTDQGFQFVVTSAGTGQGANPTITVTDKDGSWTNSPIVIVKRSAGSQLTVVDTWTVTATALTITFNGTPAATETFTYNVIKMGR